MYRLLPLSTGEATGCSVCIIVSTGLQQRSETPFGERVLGRRLWHRWHGRISQSPSTAVEWLIHDTIMFRFREPNMRTTALRKGCPILAGIRCASVYHAKASPAVYLRHHMLGLLELPQVGILASLVTKEK